MRNSRKALIFELWKDGKSYGNILNNNLNIPFTTISSFIARFKRHNTVENKKRSSAPRKISPRLSNKLGRLINQNPMVTREEVLEDLNSSGYSVTKRTISNEMLRNALNLRRPKKTPLLVKRHRYTRLKFVRQHKEKENSFWERVLWIDETKIELFGQNYRNHSNTVPMNTVPTVKFGGGSIMIWGCFSAKGVGKISVIDGKMNAQKYKLILQENLLFSVVSLELPSDYIFLQDNDPKHTAKSTRSGYLKIMLMFCNGQVSPWIWMQLGTCSDFGKFKSGKEHQQTSIIWRQYAQKNGTKYLLIIARNQLRTAGRD